MRTRRSASSTARSSSTRPSSDRALTRGCHRRLPGVDDVAQAVRRMRTVSASSRPSTVSTTRSAWAVTRPSPTSASSASGRSTRWIGSPSESRSRRNCSSNRRVGEVERLSVGRRDPTVDHGGGPGVELSGRSTSARPRCGSGLPVRCPTSCGCASKGLWRRRRRRRRSRAVGSAVDGQTLVGPGSGEGRRRSRGGPGGELRPGSMSGRYASHGRPPTRWRPRGSPPSRRRSPREGAVDQIEADVVEADVSGLGHGVERGPGRMGPIEECQDPGADALHPERHPRHAERSQTGELPGRRPSGVDSTVTRRRGGRSSDLEDPAQLARSARAATEVALAS